MFDVEDGTMDLVPKVPVETLLGKAGRLVMKMRPTALKRPEHAQEISLDGVPTTFIGSPDDPYFQTIAERAEELSILARFIRLNVARDAVVIDVGANIGLSTILMSRLSKTVHAFEASPKNAALLRENLRLNRVSNVYVHADAVSHINGSVRVHEANFGAGSHVVTGGHVAADRVATVEVACVTLDSLNLPRVEFIKIDAEGHEPNVLAGASLLLGRDTPLVYTEVNAWCLSAFAGHSLGAFVRTLWERFEVSECNSDGSIAALPDAYLFLHDLIVKRGGMSDIVIRPKQGAEMPSLPKLTWPEHALAQLG